MHTKNLLLSLSLGFLTLPAFASEVRPLNIQDSLHGPYGVAMSRGTADAPAPFPTIPSGAKVVKIYAAFFNWYDQDASRETLNVDATASGIGQIATKRVDRDKISGWDHALYTADVTQYDAKLRGGLKYATINQKFDSGAGLLVIYEDQNLPWRDVEIYGGADILEQANESSTLKMMSSGDTKTSISILMPYKTTTAGSIAVNGSMVVPAGNIFPARPVDDPMQTFDITLKDGENAVQINTQGFLTIGFVVASMQSPVF